jgi:hypothetical protein
MLKAGFKVRPLPALDQVIERTNVIVVLQQDSQ